MPAAKTGRMGRPPAGRDLAQKIRCGFERAVENLRKGGGIAGIEDIWQEMITQDPFRAFEILARYVPKEMLIEEDFTIRIIGGDPISVEDWENKFLARKDPIELRH